VEPPLVDVGTAGGSHLAGGGGAHLAACHFAGKLDLAGV